MKLGLRHIVPAVCAGISFIGVLVCAGISASLTGSQYSQQAGERWVQSGDLRCAQVTAFFSEASDFRESSVMTVREKVNNALATASLEGSADAPLWYDAYSVERGSVEVIGTKPSVCKALLTAVGGDFFQLHPMHLVNGVYLRPDDLMKDRVMIDTRLAWQTFGSSDVAGMELRVDDVTYLVAGVIEPENDKANRDAYGEIPRIYLPIEMLGRESQAAVTENDTGKLNTEPDNTAASGQYLTCYEAVLPNPVRGFAEKTVKEAVGEHDSMKLLQNTGRSSILRRWENLLDLHKMVIASDGIAYPYWENAARMTDFAAARLLLMEIIFAVLPVGWALWMLWNGYRWLSAFIRCKIEENKRRYRTIERDPYSI